MYILQNISESLRSISLVVIVGSTITLGAMMAPVIFKLLERADAAKVMITIFARYDSWLHVAVIVLLVAELLRFFVFKVHDFSWVAFLSLILTLLVFAISMFLIYKISPEILQAYENFSQDFQVLHKQSEQMHKLNFFLGLLLLFL